MYKSFWISENSDGKITVTYYHFKRNPQLPYFVTDIESANVEWVCTVKLCNTFKIFWKCLTHKFIIK